MSTTQQVPTMTAERFMRWAVAVGFALASAALWWPASAAASVRIKEVASVQGVRANQLVGYGLVVGLDGTGEQTAVTAQSLTALLQSLGDGVVGHGVLVQLNVAFGLHLRRRQISRALTGATTCLKMALTSGSVTTRKRFGSTSSAAPLA